MSDLADKIREQATITGKMIIKADSRTGSTHMTDREEWGRLMAEQLAALSREVVLAIVAADIENRKSQLEAILTCEKKDCDRALLALAGWSPTPVEGYGYNTSWAISDLCKAVQEFRAAAERQVKRGGE